MTMFRHALPQLRGGLFLTDGGIETTLIFHDGQDLPYFAAFHLLKDAAGTDALKRYFTRHASIATGSGAGFILESATWRASPDWGAKLGYTQQALDDANRKAVALLHELRRVLASDASPMVISGCIGPRGDGYDPGAIMSAAEAQAYHSAQARVLAESGSDLITAMTMTNVPEAVGIVGAARGEGMPVAISFTVETDGRLPTGETLGDAIAAVDAATGRRPAYYMVNCAHPSHFAALFDGADWTRRVRGIRANASTCSHAELNEAAQLDEGDPVELARDYAALRSRCPWITVLGGCCGTDHRHVERIWLACRAAA